MTDGLPDLQVFCDIEVVPVVSLSGHIAWGGPIWPDFDRQSRVRQCRDGVAVDRRPEPQGRPRRLRQAAVWGGALDLQFGHLVSEHLTRLPQALAERPKDLYLFGLPPGVEEAALPGWVWQVLDWHGVERRRVRFVDRPLQVDELRVAVQGEMLGKQVTPGDYLDLLDRNMQRRGMSGAAQGVVFVTRAGMVERGQGGHAGEGYLAGVLREAGVRVIDPGRMELEDQMAAYAGAGALVFSEGSALHGRTLLGRIRQDIHVLRRRPGMSIAAAQLTPRCRTLCYHAAVGHKLGAQMRNGVQRKDLTVALYDLAVVFDLFASLGHDIRPLWDVAAYQADVARDLRGWLTSCRISPQQMRVNLELIASAGFELDPSLLAESGRGAALT